MQIQAKRLLLLLLGSRLDEAAKERLGKQWSKTRAVTSKSAVGVVQECCPVDDDNNDIRTTLSTRPQQPFCNDDWPTRGEYPSAYRK